MIEVVSAGNSALMSGLLDSMNSGGAARVRLYSGARPAASASPSVPLVAQVLFADIAGTIAVNGDLQISAGVPSLLLQSTVPTWGRVFNGNDEHLFDCDVRLSGAADTGQEIVIATSGTIAGALVQILSGTFSARP